MRLSRLLRAALFFLTLAAVAQELSKPEGQRTWHGRVAGVPYDFRFPTPGRFRDAYWNPNNDRIFTDRVVGIEKGAAVSALRGLRSRLIAGGDDRWRAAAPKLIDDDFCSSVEDGSFTEKVDSWR